MPASLSLDLENSSYFSSPREEVFFTVHRAQAEDPSEREPLPRLAMDGLGTLWQSLAHMHPEQYQEHPAFQGQ